MSEPTAAPSSWTCPTCRQPVGSRFCPRCGEEPHAPRELTLAGLGEKLLHALTSMDAKTARTVWRLLRHPGALTLSWTAGERRPYVAPFQLFLLANVVFFALQWATGIQVFSSSLDSHLHHQDWSDYAQQLVQRRLAATHRTLEAYAPVFDRVVVINAKSLILLMALPFSALLPLVFLRERRPFMAHVVFALHHYTFLLLLFCVALVAARLSAWSGGGGLDSPRVDTVISLLNLAACAVYLHLAIGPVYGTRGWQRPAKAALLAVGVAVIVIGYRFLMLLITLYGT
jgi:hypothetical protein